MFVKRIETIPYGTNCYIIADDETKQGAVIDPGGSLDEILTEINKNNLVVKYIILTHFHFDHIICVEELKSVTNAQIIIHEADSEGLQDPQINLSSALGRNHISIKADIEAKDNNSVLLGEMVLKFIHTPGHTPGGMCILVDKVLFSGDTLFSLSVGRTDLPEGSSQDLVNSIKNKLFVLPSDTKVYPGHDRETDIGREIEGNPYIGGNK